MFHGQRLLGWYVQCSNDYFRNYVFKVRAVNVKISCLAKISHPTVNSTPCICYMSVCTIEGIQISNMEKYIRNVKGWHAKKYANKVGMILK